METGKLIRELRQKKGLTQEELATKTEVSARTIQRIENGEVDPRAYTLQMIAKALEVDFSIFSTLEAEENHNDINAQKLGALIHLSGLLPLLIPTLVLWHFKKQESDGLSIHFQAAMVMQLTILGITLVGLWILWKVGRPTPLYGGLLAGALISIVNAIKVFSGTSFINPFIQSVKTPNS